MVRDRNQGASVEKENEEKKEPLKIRKRESWRQLLPFKTETIALSEKERKRRLWKWEPKYFIKRGVFRASWHYNPNKKRGGF